MKKILVILVIFNGIKWLNKCIDSLRNSTIKADIFIVDNGSTDTSVEYIKENYPEAKLIVSPENLGFGKANNMGIKYAIDENYDYVYLLNQDAWVESDTFEKLINANIENPEFAIISPIQTNANKSKLDKNFAFSCPRELTSDLLCKQEIQSVYNTEFVMAAHWLISRKGFLTVGGFSPAFPHYGEDNNYLDRLIFHGLKVGICPATIGVHDREERPANKQRLFHQMKMTMIATLSNPLLSNKRKWKRLVNNFINSFSISITETIPIGFYLIRNYKKIIGLKKLSLETMAFLKDN